MKMAKAHRLLTFDKTSRSAFKFPDSLLICATAQPNLLQFANGRCAATAYHRGSLSPAQADRKAAAVSSACRVAIGKGNLRGSGLLVTDQPVHPRIHHAYRDLICTRLERCRRIYSVWRMPRLSQFLSIDGHDRQVLYITQINPQPRAFPEPRRRGLQNFRAYPHARKVLHARIIAALQSESSFIVTKSGAPRPGWNETFQGPLENASPKRRPSLIYVRHSCTAEPFVRSEAQDQCG